MREVSDCQHKAGATCPCGRNGEKAKSFEVLTGTVRAIVGGFRISSFSNSYVIEKSGSLGPQKGLGNGWISKHIRYLTELKTLVSAAIATYLTISMRQTVQLLQHNTLVTLFTRRHCSLCDNAKSVISNLTKKKAFDYQQVDVMASDQQQWRLLYEFDTPVVGVVITL